MQAAASQHAPPRPSLLTPHAMPSQAAANPLDLKLTEAFESAKLYKILNTLLSAAPQPPPHSLGVLDTLGQG